MTQPDPDREALLREAARILIRLNENPDDPDAREARDHFVARGAAEQKAFEAALRMWKVGGRKKPPRPGATLACLLVAGLAATLAYAPLRLAALADWQTGFEISEVTLSSGDIAYLDADSAIADASDGTSRRIRLLQGAGYFDVETAPQSFVVEAGPLTATALGTAFEVSHLGDTILVAVSEGAVEVQVAEMATRLDAGERLLWSPAGGISRSEIEATSIAPWRQGQFVLDDLTFRQVIDVIDRRLPGHVLIFGEDLAGAAMTGTIDLTRPEAALEVLAASRRARTLSLTPLITMIRPGD